IAATGDGKSAAFQVPILVHDKISRHPELYPGILARKNTVGVIAIPTKGLATNIVKECDDLGISAFAYTHENITRANKEGIDLVAKISNCSYSIVCVDPEHLKKSPWVCIAQSPVFRSNILFACAEEAHLIEEWGNVDFCADFRYIGTFFRSKLPFSKSVIALSATVEPGQSTSLICHGEVFPQLLPYLSTGRKTIIHCQTLDTVYRVYVYLIQFLDETNYDSLRRIRVYHSLCSEKYNNRTLAMLEKDPMCQVCIAIVAFVNGINVHMLLISISLG
ncbi:hypothetical protein BT96DRAFT_795464, partial [Gymnopus androsaceus JB14]